MRPLRHVLVAAAAILGSCAEDRAVDHGASAGSELSRSSTSTSTSAPSAQAATSAPVTTRPSPEPPQDPAVEPASPPTDEEPFLRLVGRTFAGTDVTEGGVRRQLVDGTELTVKFQRNGGDDGVVWDGGCNTTGGGVTVTDDRLDVTHDGGSTAVGCSEEHYAQDDWLTAFFRADPAWTLNERVLTLSSGDTVVTLHERS